MKNPQTLNLNPNSSEPGRQDASSRDSVREKMGELIEQTRSEVRNMRVKLDRQEDENEFQGRRTKILAIVLCALMVILAAAFWFVYPTVQEQPQTAEEMLSLKKVASTLDGSVQALEGKLNKTAAGLPGLTTRMDQLQEGMKSTMQSAQAAATQVGQRIRQDFNQTVQVIQSRLSGLESNQRESSERVNQLQQQVASLKQELASMRTESTEAAEKIKQQFQEEQQARASVQSNIDQKMATHQTTLDSLSNRVDRKRVEFDLTNRKTTEIAPGILLTINRSNTGKQQVDGTLQVAAESRSFELRAQGIQKPLVFYTAGETRPMEVVFTNVTKTGAAGYVMMPTPAVAARAENIR